jgi:deazaflavin-dependent oxidoreductase (nitroreductase family)
MFRFAFRLVRLILVGAFGWMAFVVVAMRTKSPWMLGVVRHFNRSAMNKVAVQYAGTPGAYASIIKHRGRRSGTVYETPIVPFATADGYLVSLPYGPDTDWVKNVLAAGSAELVTDGATHAVDQPEVVDIATVTDEFPPNEQRTHRWFGVTSCLRLRRVESADRPKEDTPATS